jgi:hypothetical protein
MKRIAAVAVLLALFFHSHGQNLVPNPSFETQTGCPTTPGNFSIVGNWFVCPTHGGSPDYHHVCGSSTFGVPVNIFGNQLARTGSAYIGFVTNFGGGDFREYLEVLLTTPLTGGTSYTATAYLSLSDGSGWATDGFGFYLSTGVVSGTGPSTPLPFTPQVSNSTNNFINSWTNWMPVTGTFVATAGMQYLTIGNFKNDASTNVQVQSSGWSWNYTYADDISITPTIILSSEMGDFVGELVGNAVQLDWNSIAEMGTVSYEVERSIGNTLKFERIGTVAAKGSATQAADYDFADLNFDPNQVNYYRLKEIDQNGGGGYSTTISIQKENVVENVELFVYPNPLANGESLNVNFNCTKERHVKMQVMDVQGRLIRSEELDAIASTNMLEIDINGYAPGVYLLKIAGEGLDLHKKFVVTNN